ncbi:hypothetical protein PIB30_004840 [Stylosanthes scabra]|uniref:Uncharacterized protein n=1 Tax=Stylosanthes scabra TaxID=79078 RepID=A0ABU6U416_9FABA|nr:hypothetical protein [Stylosanthes scabra]
MRGRRIAAKWCSDERRREVRRNAEEHGGMIRIEAKRQRVVERREDEQGAATAGRSQIEALRSEKMGKVTSKTPQKLRVVVAWHVVFVSLVSRSGQNALQRLLAFMLDEPCSTIGPVGPHNLLLFGSEILTCEIAVARASISTHPSSSSESQLSEDKDSLRELLPNLFLPNLVTGAVTNRPQDAPTWCFIFVRLGSDFNVRSV